MTDKIKKYKAYIIEALLFAALLAVDLISKPLAFSFLESKGGSYTVFEGIFEMIEVHNDGASFGIFGGKTTGLIVTTAIAMVLLTGFLIWRPKSPKLFRYGVIAIVAGGVGNLVDRIVYGYVRDFIDYTFLRTFFGIENFGVGNIADIFVLVGLLCIMVYVFFGYKEGDFAKNPNHSDTIPEVLVVDEGEEKKTEKQSEKSGVVEDGKINSTAEEELCDNKSVNAVQNVEENVEQKEKTKKSSSGQEKMENRLADTGKAE